MVLLHFRDNLSKRNIHILVTLAYSIAEACRTILIVDAECPSPTPGLSLTGNDSCLEPPWMQLISAG